MRLRACLPLLGLIFLTGCPTPPDTTAPTPTDESTVEPSPAPVEVTIAGWPEIEQTIASHKGKVVVVDLWSLTCVPCVREFPHLVELDEKHDDELVCIAVNLDFYGAKTEPPESYREAVEEFLTEENATFENFLCSEKSDDALAKAGATSMPAVLVYNRDGEMVKMFEEDGSYGENGFTYQDHIGPLVAKLVVAK